MKRLSLFYTILLVFVSISVLTLIHFGSALPSPVGESQAIVLKVENTGQESPALMGFVESLRVNFEHPLSRLFVQLLVIVTAARLIGKLFTGIGQPSVVGEMAAGILLGPSLLGYLSPDTFEFIFSKESLGSLKLLSQIGVCFFMFVVGMELDMKHVRSRAQAAVAVSHASIAIPFLLGVILAYFLYSDLAAHGSTFTSFALFMGISMSITAFPVLARILQERNLAKTFLGSTAITCAAVDDVTAWSMLAFVVAIARSSSLASCMLSLLMVFLFVSFMIFIVRPALLKFIGEARLSLNEPSKEIFAVVILIVLAASLTTEVIGIHALFGAFLAGAVMPDMHGFRDKITVRVENFSTILLLPLFFAFTGLRTQIGLIASVNDWILCFVVISVATMGKLGGSAFAARFTGMGWRDSLQLGALMNTRGLMELIALNIGYDLGILSPRIFTMLVIMALVTTTMTGPLLTLFKGPDEALAPNNEEHSYV